MIFRRFLGFILTGIHIFSLSSGKMSQTEPKNIPRIAEHSLTFGLEIEFIVAAGIAGCPDPHPRDPRLADGEKLFDVDLINYDILEKLKAVDIPAIVDEPSERHTTEAYQKCWLLKSDVTVGGEDSGGNTWDKRYLKNGMEMSSPPYYYGEPARKAIRTVLQTVRKSYRVCVDQSAGLHVHVGNSYSGFQFPILRNLIAIAYTYEPQLLLVLPEGRTSNYWCLPLSNSRFGWTNADMPRTEALERILKYTNIPTLISDFGTIDYNRLAFNFKGLRTPYVDEKRTVEFRHHHGSLDPEAILHWIHICVKFVEKACHSKDDELFARLRQDISKPVGFGEKELSTIDFLMWLGCPAQAYYYGIRILIDKPELEKRIERDRMRHEEHIIRARGFLEKYKPQLLPRTTERPESSQATGYR